MKKLLVLLPWTEFHDVHLVKDVGLFPEYFSIEYKIPVDFVFLDNEKTGTKKSEYHGMRLIKLPALDESGKVPRLLRHPLKFFKFLKIFTDFLKENKSIYSYVMMFHINSTTLYFADFIKKLSRKIRIYIKCDADSFKRKQWIYLGKILEKADALSIESEKLADEAKKRFKQNTQKIQFAPNGFDDRNFDKNLLSLPKENLIIQTARFGTAQKNTRLLLKILSEVDLRNWKAVLAGTIEKDFLTFLNDFFEKRPDLKEKIIFAGNITGRNELYKLYARASIFILTSRYESFSLSVMESAFFGDYVVSTNVGISDTVRRKFRGFVADGNPLKKKNDAKIASEMEGEIKKCIENPERCAIDFETQEKIRSYFSMSSIVKMDLFRKFFGEEK